MKTILFSLTFLAYTGLLAQEIDNQNSKTSDDAKPWKVGGNFGLQFTQAAYQNWQAGGINSFAGNSLLSWFANYEDNGNWTWINQLDFAYGLNYQDSAFNKTDDRIELLSRVDRKITEKWWNCVAKCWF